MGLPNCLQCLRSSDSIIGSNQRKSLDKCCCSNDAVGWIPGIGCRKCQRAHADSASNRQNNESGFDFCEKSFQAGAQLDPAFVLNGGNFEQCNVGYRKPFATPTCFRNSCSGPLLNPPRFDC